MPPIRIAEIQGPGLTSPLANQRVVTRGVVTGATRKGFFLQDPEDRGDIERSCAVFVFRRRSHPPIGSAVEVEGKVLDFLASERDRPTTQLVAGKVKVLRKQGPPIEPIWLTAALLDCDGEELALRLNAMEGMLVGIEAGATFVAPSNPYGDYVVLPIDTDLARSPAGGVLIDPDFPDRWLPSFRITDYSRAPRVNVGATLLSPITGPLNYRASSYQIATRGPMEVEPTAPRPASTTLRAVGPNLTVMTLNGFNLDPNVENPALVVDPQRDVDDDIGDGRYRALAAAIVHQASTPDVVALQEIQDDDGAEVTTVVGAARGLEELIRCIRKEGGPPYQWADIPPVAGADGGQPGGNIRNAFLLNPARVALVEGSLHRIGNDDPAFEGSRKPLVGQFELRTTGSRVWIFNVHLASKRHQHPIFAPESPGLDPRAPLRTQQVESIRRELLPLVAQDQDTYITGDFNDFEFSPTLQTLLGAECVNLVEQLPREQRYDYNHRGISQALIHGVVSRRQFDEGRAAYEILHGNELIGVQPGQQGERATDHAYGIASLKMP